MNFVHLRLHTEYSLVDSTVRIKPLVKEVNAQNMAAVALTDQSNLFAMVKFYRAALGAGLKPLIGADMRLQADEGEPDHLLLLCQNTQGYRNLTKLISRAWQEGQHQGVAQIKREWIEGLSEGLIALSGGRSGDIGRALVAGQKEVALEALTRWKKMFPGRFYLELQRTGRPSEENYVHQAVDLALETETPVVATNDVCFLKQDEFDAHEARVCIHDGYVLSDSRRPKRYSDQQYLRSPEEMTILFEDLPEALENTVEIARRCNLTFNFGDYYLPDFPIPDGMTMESFFSEEARKGLEVRLDQLFDRGADDFAKIRKAYDERLQIELDVINQMGFPGYFMIVSDFIQWAKDNNVPVGPGRGSGAGSLVAYALKITDLDPLRYDLLFERFLNPERVSMPDFDVDFCMEKRDLVIDYVARKYGREKVSQIITYGSMAAKAVVRDVGRVLDHPYGFVDRIAKLIPFEIKMTLTKALDQSEELKERYDNEEEVRMLIDLALSLEGLSRNAGKHAGGVVIAPTALVDFTPLYCEEDGSSLVTQFDKDDVETIGLVKFDFLGLRNLTIIQWALDMANARLQAKGEALIDINRLDLEDKPTFDLLKAQKTTAIFQLESRGMKELIKRLQPDVFEDIVALVALYRPGPLQSGMVDDFVNRKHGLAKVEYPHPDLEPILKPTYGIILYQEQVMQIAQVLAGYSLGGADILRRAMGKKKQEVMDQQRGVFIEGCSNNNVDKNTAIYLFDLIDKFSGYGFNKSHSAAYALVSFQTAWLKAHYPAEFMAAVLSADMDNTEKVVMLIDECRQLGLTVLPPDINRSAYRFTVDDKQNVIYGLGAIKGAGESALSGILAEREAASAFSSLADLCKRMSAKKVSKRVLETLIKSGALDGLGGTRQSLFEFMPEALRMADQYQRDEGMGQVDLFGGAMSAEVTEQAQPDKPEWPERERLRLEKATLGLYLSGHPIKEYEAELKQFVTKSLAELNTMSTSIGGGYQQQKVTVAGMISSIRTQITDQGKRAFFELDDHTAHYEFAAFTKTYEEFGHLLEKDEIIILEGSVGTNKRTGNLQVRLEALYTMEMARQRFARRLFLKINQQQVSQTLLPQLQALLQNDREEVHCPVFIRYETEHVQADVRLGRAYRLQLSGQNLEQLRGILGEQAVNIMY